MGVSIEQYRQRIGCFARVASVLSSFKVRGYRRNTFSQQSKVFGTALRVIMRLCCLVVLIAAVIPSSSFVLDLTQFGDVEKNPGPKSAQNYKFHLIDPHQFEKFAATVLKETYKIPFLIVEKGRDEGYDAVESRVDIDLGGGNILKNQNVVVQVKHTTRQSAVLTDAIRKRVFEKKKDKVKKRIADIYIIFTNYQLSFGQCVKLEKIFEDAETKKVVVVGYETLSLWLNSSPELQRKVIRLYPRGHLTDLANCPKAVQSIQLLERYREDLNEIIDVKAFTIAKQIVESDKSFVLITGLSGSGKTTTAKKLVVQLFDKYDSFTYYNITYLNDFDKYWISGEKSIFFMDNILDDDMNKWYKLEVKLKIAIEQGSKFVFLGQSVALKQALKASHLNDVYKYLCDGAIDLSNERFNLSKDEKQEMLKKHVEMGDIDTLTKKALLKKKMVSHAAEINCPCFPLVAKSLGSRRRLEEFKSPVPTKRKTPVYNKKFLNTFFEWVRSTNEDSDSISDESCESPPPRLPRQETSGLLKDQDYKFHLIGHDEFEKFAATVVGARYNIKTLLTFSEGEDVGRDATARGVNIDLGGGHILRNQNLVVQVKHTGKESETITDTIRRNVFEKEKKKVEKLVKKKQLDTYIMFTNYEVPPLQEEKLVECFTDAKNVGAKNVIIVGKETLSQWLNDSPELRRKVIRQYPYLIDYMGVQSIQLLKRYREDLDKVIDVKAFTKAKEIVESDNGLVFITGLPGSGKTTVAKKLAVQLLDKFDYFTYYEINFPHDFDEYWHPAKKYIFFVGNMNSENMNDWNTLKDSVSDAIEHGSKFVFVGPSVALKEASKKQRFNNFYEYLCDGAIDLSDEQFNLSKYEKQVMLKKQVGMGDNDSLTKEALLKDGMVSYATEINSPCFPLVASSLGSRRCLERFKTKMLVPTVYNKEFLDQFFKWIQSTTEHLDSSSESSESPAPERPRLERKPWSPADITDSDSNSGSCASPTAERPPLQSDPSSTDNNGDNITGTSETRKNSCDPPDISVAILKLDELDPPSKSSDSVELPIDVLLLVDEDDSLLSSYSFLNDAFKSCMTDLGIVYFGVTGDGQNKVNISLVRCGKGSTQVCGSQNVAITAIKTLKPKALFSVGFCAGLNRTKAKLGDVVISAKLSTFGGKKIINDQRQWDGRKLDVSRKFRSLILSAADGWKAPLKNKDARNVIVHREAEMFSGAEVENSLKECKRLCLEFPEAIAIEQGGQGVYSASFDRQLEWVVIKGISHYADDGEPDAKWRRFSSVMAASVVFNILKQPDVLKGWNHYQEIG